jgi:hypothetical protein
MTFNGDRGTKSKPVSVPHQVYGFLTTSPNAVVSLETVPFFNGLLSLDTVAFFVGLLSLDMIVFPRVG